MTYFYEQFDRWAKAIEQKQVLLCLDYDGTLVPIAPTPALAIMGTEERHLLEELSATPGIIVVFISGRSLANLKTMVGVDHVLYSGNHGVEIEGIDAVSSVTEEYRASLVKITEDLKQRYAAIAGITIEEKGVGIAVHYRQADATKISDIERIFSDVCEPYFSKGQAKKMIGKKVLEVRPAVDCDKGTAVRLFYENFVKKFGEQGLLALYVGDDVTDEHAFEALRPCGVTIKVGEPGQTQAEFYLKDQEDVLRLLKDIIKLKKG